MRIVVVVVVLLMSSVAFAEESLSDLNLDAFKDLSAKREGAVSSNPFAVGGGAAGELAVEDLSLTGIVTNDEDQFALVSGFLIRPGDLIAGYKVTTIESTRVVLKRFDEMYILTLGGGW